MTYTEAQTEFSVRLYRWAKAALETEMRESFPSFRFCKEWPSRKCQFLMSLDQHSRLVLAHAMLLARHQVAAKALNEAISKDAAALMRREEGYRLRTSPGTWEGIFASANTASKPNLTTRRQLKRAMKEHFLTAFGNQCLPPDPLGDKAGVNFRMKCHGWTIKTYFEFGRWEPEVSLEHDVWTGKWITKEEPAVLTANSIGIGLNYGNEIGIGSGWENIEVENIEVVCAEIMGHCRRMLDMFPVLLEGLDPELLTIT